MIANFEKTHKPTLQEACNAVMSLSDHEFWVCCHMDALHYSTETVSIQQVSETLRMRPSLVKWCLKKLRKNGWLDITIGTESVTFLSPRLSDKDLANEVRDLIFRRVANGPTWS